MTRTSKVKPEPVAESVEPTEVEIAAAPEDRIVTILPTRSKINPTKPGDNAWFAEGMNLFITTNASGVHRAVASDTLEAVVGDDIKLVHATRGSTWGVVPVIGTVIGGVANGVVNDESIALRVTADRVVKAAKSEDPEVVAEAEAVLEAATESEGTEEPVAV